MLLATTRGRQQGDPKVSGLRPREEKRLSYYAAEAQPRVFLTFGKMSACLSYYPVISLLIGVLYCLSHLLREGATPYLLSLFFKLYFFRLSLSFNVSGLQRCGCIVPAVSVRWHAIAFPSGV